MAGLQRAGSPVLMMLAAVLLVARVQARVQAQAQAWVLVQAQVVQEARLGRAFACHRLCLSLRGARCRLQHASVGAQQ